MFSLVRIPVGVLLPGAILAAGVAAQTPFDVSVTRLAGAPTLLHHAMAGPLVALRLSSPIPRELPSGAVELVQELARPAATAAADRLGAELELRVEPDHAVITLVGAADRLGELVAILREAVDEPDLAVEPLRVARARAEDRLQEALDRPDHRLRQRLRASLRSDRGPPRPASRALDADAIGRAAALLYAPDRNRLVVVGGAVGTHAAGLITDWPSHPVRPPAGTSGEEEPPDPATEPPTHGFGAALPAGAAGAPLAVAAELLDRRAGTSPAGAGRVEAWATDGGGALVLVGGPAGGQATRLRGMVADLLVDRDLERAARAAAAALRRRLQLRARTALGRAEVIGRLADLEGRPDGAVDLLAGLARIGAADVRRVLESAVAAQAVEVEP